MVINRGDIWIAGGGAGRLSSKPRPVLVIRSDLFPSENWVTVLPLTSTTVESPLRVTLASSPNTGITRDSQVMIDKIHTMPIASLRERCGATPKATLREIERMLAVYLGIG